MHKRQVKEPVRGPAADRGVRPTKSLVILVALASALFAADAKRPITDTDLYSFKWIADARISPDGSKVIYTLVNVSPQHDGYENALWIIPSAGGPARQLTAGPHDSSARWSPDGKRVAFVRATSKDGATAPQIYILSMSGGDAHQVTDMPRGATGPVWSPDSRHIAFLSSAQPKDFEKKSSAEPESDVRIITRAEYRSNGSGFREEGRPEHIWVVDPDAAPGVKPTQITTGEFEEEDPVWSRNNSKIYFTSNRTKESYYKPEQNAIYSIASTGGATTKITSIEGPAALLSLSPDGNRLAFVGHTNKGEGVVERQFSQPDLYITSLQPDWTPRNLTVTYDFDVAGGVGGDQAPPRGGGPSKPFWSADSRAVFVVCGEQGRTNLKRITTDTGRVDPVTNGDFDLFSYTATADGSKIAALISTPANIGDLFIVDAKTGTSKQITHIDEELFSQLNLTEPEMIRYKSFDGKMIQAWVQKPPDFQAGKKYPMILDIHGGPNAAYGYTFDHEFQWMAAKGYIVLYPNPRGSTTYGQDFGNVIQYRYPGDDYKDLMAGVDELVTRGWVDPAKLGVTGGSGGGVLTNWTIGHTNRFKAAVSQRSIADWAGWWYTADFSQFNAPWFRGAPWEDEAGFRERSPITYILKVDTPLMLIEGDADLRTPPADGGEQMFRALKYLKKPVVMIRFPGESHELSRSGKPAHRVERLDHIMAWFDKYLDGKEIHTYDQQ
jgi:dipeptidyl aminopeptidase/acylaminoacyl peptidase